MKIRTIIIISTICFTGLGFITYVLGLYFNPNVELLGSQYPVYNSQKKEFVLQKSRPRSWVNIREVSRYAKWAIIISEDWAFYNHKGVDLNQLEIVIRESLENKELTRGASTITQQVVKNVFLSSERSLWRKFKEMIWAYKIENLFSKDKILEVYLNIVELGKDTYGIRNGAEKYFYKSPKYLTAKEGAFLAMLLPSPIRYSQSFRQRELTDFAKGQIRKILIKMRQADIHSEEDRLNAMKQKFWWEPASPTPNESIWSESMMEN